MRQTRRPVRSAGAVALWLTATVASGSGEPPATIDQTDPAFWAMTRARVADLGPEVYRARAAWLLSQVTFEAAVEALDLLQKAAGLAPRDPAVLADAAVASAAPYRWTWDRDERRIEAAADLLDRARAIDPDRPEVRRASGLLGMLGNRLAEAEADLRAALAAAPDDVESLLLLGTVLRLQERYREAYDVYDRAIDLAPADWRGWSGMADVYRDDQWYEEALNLYRKAAELHAGAFPPRFGQITVYQRLGLYPIAQGMQQDLIRKFPRWDNLLLLNAAADNMRRGHYDTALEELEQIDLGGRRGLCRGTVEYRLGVCRRRLGDLEGAAAALRTAVDDYPEARNGSDYAPLVIFPASLELAAVYEDLGRPQDAADVLERASVHAGAPLSVQMQLAATFAGYSLHGPAAAALRRGLASERPGDRLSERVRLRVELARELGAGGEAVAEAAAALEAIAAEVRGAGAAVDCLWLARGFSIAGQPERAVEWLEEAVERGWGRYEAIRAEPDLEPIRSLPAYRALMKGR